MSKCRCYNHDVLSKYFEYAKSYPLLEEGEERILLNKVFSKDSSEAERTVARNKIINSNLKLVIKQAFKYVNNFNKKYLDVMDLINAGNVGLIEALDSFDPVAFSNRFSTFATYKINSRVKEHFREFSAVIKRPSHIIEKIIKYKNLEKDIEGFNNLSNDFICEKLGFSTKELDMVRESIAVKYDYLDEALTSRTHSESDETKLSVIKDELAPNTNNIIDKKEFYELIEKLIDGLGAIEKDIIMSRFLYNDAQDKKSLAELGEKYKLSKERIRQIEYKAIKILRRKMSKKTYAGIRNEHYYEQ